MKNTKLWIALGAILAAALMVLWMINPAPEIFNTGSGTVVLSGNTPRPVREAHAQLDKHADPAKQVKIVVGLKLRDEPKLDALIASQGNPASADFQKFLTTADFDQRYAANQTDFDKVVDFLTSKGLKVTYKPSNRQLVGATGTIEQVEKAFGVKINQYRYHGATYLSNEDDPLVPAYLQPIVQSVQGLNTFARFHADPKMVPGSYHQSVMRAGPLAPGPRPKDPDVMGMGPQDMALVYDYPNSNNSARGPKYSGAGYTVAIATAFVYAQSDVDTYWAHYGIKRTGKVTNVPVGGTTSETNGETTLDLQQIGAQAPGANIIMYEGVDADFATFTQVFNQIVVDNKADVISVSWGLCERDTGSAQMQTESTVFKQAAAQGIVIFSAAGDNGAYDCVGDKTPVLSVDFPSSDPNVTAVGGTSLSLNDNGSRKSEVVWTGAGGGISGEYPTPVWQSGPGLAKNDKRQLSDLAALADPDTGYSIYFQDGWGQAGGTSFAAPNMSALWVLCDQAAGQRVGGVNPILYRIGRSPDYAEVFFDVTNGNNGNGQGAGYSAGPGWDCPTGWGVPRGAAFSERVKHELGKVRLIK